VNGSAFTFANPAAVHWLWMVAGLAVLAAWRLRGRARALAAFADAPLLASIAPGAGLARPLLRAVLGIAGLAVLVFAVMDPRWGEQTEEVRRRGADVFFVIDVSRSMSAEDASPNRLARARQFVEETVESLAGDRVGLVEFAGTAQLKVPLTLNYGAMRSSLQDLRPLGGARGGTALANAIELAAGSFPKSAGASRAIVVLSDGEDLAGAERGGEGNDPVAAARAALEKDGVHVFTVGIGDAREGGRIPESRTAQGVRYLVHEGQEVWSRMDERTLREAALAGGGAFIPAGTGQVDMPRAYAQTVGELERREFESRTVTHRTPRFQWFAGIAFALLLAGALVPDRRAVPKAVTA
jgi:Ca-activated chloride channel family protein